MKSVQLLMVAVCVSGCMRTVSTTTYEVAQRPPQSEELRPATNLPGAFVPLTENTRPGDCPVRLRDPGLGTTLTLQRASLLPVRDSAGATAYRGYGDYQSEPRGRYGELEGQGLRVDCVRLRALGVVKLD